MGSSRGMHQVVKTRYVKKGHIVCTGRVNSSSEPYFDWEGGFFPPCELLHEASIHAFPFMSDDSSCMTSLIRSTHLSGDGDLNLNTGLDVDDDLLDDLSRGVEAVKKKTC